MRIANIPVRFVLGAGGLFRVQRTQTTTEFAEFVPDCDLGAGRCEVTYTQEKSTDTDYRVLPNLRFEIDLGGLAFSYIATFDTDDIRATTHSLGVGVVL